MTRLPADAAARHRVLLLAAALVFACTGAPDAGPAAPVLRLDGLGALKVGMTVSQASTALGDSLAVTYELFDYECDYVTSSSLPPDTWLMVVGDTVVRIDVGDSSSVVTEEGAGIGTPEAQLLTMYVGRVRVESHAYSGPQWHYVIVDRAPGDTTYAFVFETDGQRVRRFRGGLRPAVEWIEGCA
jgi:hypothetical protein